MRIGIIAAALAAATLGFGQPAIAQSGDSVVAIVNGKELTRSVLEASYKALPDEYQRMPLESIYDPLLQRLVDGELLLQAAESQNIADDPDVQLAIKHARDEALRRAYLNREVEARASDENLRTAYEARRLEPGFSYEEVKARHILLDTEDEANEVIAALAEGADFAELAVERSTGPSGPSGGDLGYFQRGAMVAEFSAAAFSIEPGSYGENAVETQFGWHVILVEDKRVVEPSFEETEASLREELANKAVTQLLEEARAGAEIKRFDLDGTERPAE